MLETVEIVLQRVEVGYLWLKEKEEEKQQLQQTNNNNNKGFRSRLEATHADDVVHMDDTLRIIDNLCENVSQASLKQVPENNSCTCIMELFGVYIKFIRGGNGKSLNNLVVVQGHDRDFARTDPSFQRGRLDATPGIHTSYDPMVIRIWQVELCMVYPKLLRPDVSAAHNPPRCAR